MNITLYCPKCGYNLTGLAEDRCPECGEGFDPTELERTQIAAARFSVSAVIQIVLVPGSLAVLYPCLLFVGVFIRNDYSHLPIDPAAIVAVGGAAMLHGLFLGRRYGNARPIIRGEESCPPIFLSPWGYGLALGLVEVTLTAFYVAGGCTVMFMF